MLLSLEKEQKSCHMPVWMSLEDIMLREIRQLEKDDYYSIPFT